MLLSNRVTLAMYIESGEAAVSLTDNNGVEHSIHVLKKGDYFGGMY